MTRFPIFLLAVFPAFALDNAITFRPYAYQENRPFDLFPTFAKDEVCSYPRPYVNGQPTAQWQTDIWSKWGPSTHCPAGSIKKAYVAFLQTVDANQTVKVDFRDDPQPCHLGDENACREAGMDQNAMLGYSSWEATIRASAYPTSVGTTTHLRSAREMMSAGAWSYRRRGPLVTQVMVEDRSPARSYDFGWRERRLARVTSTMSQESLSVKVNADWSGLPRPFKVHVDGEFISICYATSDTWYVGVTDGSGPECASIAGRAQDGSGRGNHYADELRTFARLIDGMRLAAGTDYGRSTIQVDDASSINEPTVVNIFGEFVRICNKNGNTLTVGTGPWGCAPDINGRFFWGSNRVLTEQFRNIPVQNWNRDDNWIDADIDRYKSLHPVFVLSFYNGWPGVGIEYHLANPWSDRLQDQMYDLSVANSGGALISYNGVKHTAASMWKYPDGPVVGTFTDRVAERKAWDGPAPVGGRYDFNLPYLRYAGVVPYDPSIKVDQHGVDSMLTVNRPHEGTMYAWENGNKGIIDTVDSLVKGASRTNCAAYHRHWPDAGGRPDISLHPLWTAVGLYSMSSDLPGADRWYEVMFGNSACAGYPAVHMWEGNSSESLKFCSASDTPFKSCEGEGGQVPAFGRPYSIDAHPGAVLMFAQSNTDVKERLLYQGQDTYNFWASYAGTSHVPEMSFIPWLLTGDWYLEQSAMDFGSWALLYNSGSPFWNGRDFYATTVRHGSWGWPGPVNGSRPIGWAFRLLTHAAWASATGSLEAAYFNDKFNKTIEIKEGKYNLQGIFYHPCEEGKPFDSTPWCWGRMVQGMNTQNVALTSFLASGSSYDPQSLSPSTNASRNYVNAVTSFWMDNFFRVSLGDAINLGFDQAAYLGNERFFRNAMNRFTHPAMNPFTNGEYRDPWAPCEPEGVEQPDGCPQRRFGTGIEYQFSSYENFAKAFIPRASQRREFENDRDKQGGYSVIAASTLAFATDARDESRSGQGAWEWQKFGIRDQEGYRGTPQWAFSAQSQHRVSDVSIVPGAAGVATVYFVAPGYNTCTYLVSPTYPNSSLDLGETQVAAGNLQRRFDLIGLSPGPQYLRITCDAARTVVEFTAQ
ncbi:MAG: hypothetical protein IT168_16460 [Bryobacterales bacterium]|nr:hypothetical protein [Bryobacterales bacterium]